VRPSSSELLLSTETASMVAVPLPGGIPSFSISTWQAVLEAMRLTGEILLAIWRIIKRSR